MKFWAGLMQFLAVALFAVIAMGCDPTTGSNVNHEDDPDFVRGKNRLARKDIAGSILSFEKAIANNPANDFAHFELALIFYSPSSEDHTDYVAACYHLQRHILLKPDSKHANNIVGMIKVCKKEIAKDIAMAPIPLSEINAIHTLRTKLAKANADNANLKTQVEAMRGRLNQKGEEVLGALVSKPVGLPLGQSPLSSPPRGSTTGSSDLPAANGRRTHKLKPRESLYSVARQYGVPFAQLKAANPRLARNPRDLKPGVTVNIPLKRN
ncbi:MAG: LysM domain-containing protein [Verrucomicrobiota bacterium]|nr:LysM domain-containing protein [Verrucomicrobiota bacterium]